MSNIIDLKPITPTKNYYHGRYLNIEIVMDKEGRINVSKLMKKYGGTDGLRSWKRNYKNYLLLVAYAELKGVVVSIPPPPRDDNKAKEEACQELLIKLGNVVTLANIDKNDRSKSNEIIGTYQSQRISNSIAMSISAEFYFAVMDIIEEYTNRKTQNIIQEKDTLNVELRAEIDSIKKLISGGQDETQKRLLYLNGHAIDTKVKIDKMDEKMDELLNHVKKCQSLITNTEYSNECVVLYRCPGDPKDYIRHRAGTKEYVEQKMKEDKAIDIQQYTNVSNGKMIIRYAKDAKMIPKDTKKIKDDRKKNDIPRRVLIIKNPSDRLTLRRFLKGIDNSYKVVIEEQQKKDAESQFLSCKSE